jgi:hypothetical protein
VPRQVARIAPDRRALALADDPGRRYAHRARDGSLPYSLFHQGLATFNADDVHRQSDAAGFIRLEAAD